MNIALFGRLLSITFFFALAQSFVSIHDPTLYSYLKPVFFIIAILGATLPFNINLLRAVSVSILLDFFLLLPEAPNHRHVLAVLGFSFLLALLKKDDDKFNSVTLPAIRYSTAIVYFFAFFAKLNIDYINPEFSCSTKFYNNIHGFFPFFPESEFLNYFIIYSSIILEAALPVFLILFPRVTVPIAVLFHLGLSFDLYQYFTNFSAVMFLCLASFIPSGTIPDFKIKKPKLLSFITAILFLTIVIAGHSLYHLVSTFPPEQFRANVYNFVYFRHAVWCIYAFTFSWFIISFLFKNPIPKISLSKNFFALFIPALVLINGLSPYIGLKTRTSFNMYSNLRMGSDYSNHLLVPRSLDLFGYLDLAEQGVAPNSLFAKKFLSFRQGGLSESRKCVW